MSDNSGLILHAFFIHQEYFKGLSLSMPQLIKKFVPGYNSFNMKREAESPNAMFVST
jgi:hypothetical protein